jgi:hypothetical protein
MIGKTMPGNVLLQSKISQLQAQLTQALNTYKATGNQSSLIAALQLQTQISELLLNATAMSTPTAVAQSNTIKTLT